MSAIKTKAGSGLLDAALVRSALWDALCKLSPRTQWANPVMFVVYLGAMLTTLLWAQGLLEGRAKGQVLGCRCVGCGAEQHQSARLQRIQQLSGRVAAHAGGHQGQGRACGPQAQVSGHSQRLGLAVCQAGALQTAARGAMAHAVKGCASPAMCGQGLEQVFHASMVGGSAATMEGQQARHGGGCAAPGAAVQPVGAMGHGKRRAHGDGCAVHCGLWGVGVRALGHAGTAGPTRWPATSAGKPRRWR